MEEAFKAGHEVVVDTKKAEMVTKIVRDEKLVH